MKFRSSVLTILGGVVLFSFSQASVMIGLRGDEKNTEFICSTLPNCRPVVEETREFSNGNTFVRFKSSVAGEEVIVSLPKVMTTNQFMEALIKIRTAKTEFAAMVTVRLPDDYSQIRVLDEEGKRVDLKIHRLLAAAGASKAIHFDFTESPITLEPRMGTSGARITKTVVVTDNHPVLAQELAEKLAVELMTVEEARRRGMSQPMQIIYLTTPVDPHNTSFLKALASIDTLAATGSSVQYVTPYLPYARSDKKDQAGVTVTGRLIADLVQAAGSMSVSFVRAHAPQSQGFFFVPTVQTMGRDTINEHLKSLGVQQVVSPDAGFQKDATLYADALKVPVSVINKQRNLETGEAKLHDMSGPSPKGLVVALIDDETASGGTGAKAAEFLKTKYEVAKVIMVVTHLAGNAKQAIDSPHIDEIVVTNTFPVKPSERVKVLSIAGELAKDLSPLVIGRRCLRVVHGGKQ